MRDGPLKKQHHVTSFDIPFNQTDGAQFRAEITLQKHLMNKPSFLELFGLKADLNTKVSWEF